MITKKIEAPLRGLAAIGLALALACGGADEERAPAETSVLADDTPVVADSLIEQDVQSRIDADPRLNVDGVSITASSANQVVSLVGEVPSRLESSIAEEVAMSVLGVKEVVSESLQVASERQ